METSIKGIDLIKRFEGLKLTAYKCAAGVLTIGYGHTGSDVKPGMSITRERAEQLLVSDLERFEKGVDALNMKVNQNQFDALVSFSFNLGVAALSGSTLVKKARVNPNDPAIRTEFAKWVNAGGKRLDGLVRRRTDEASLYFES